MPAEMMPRRVVIAGAGTMGARIALCFARAGATVTATARRDETLRAAAAIISAAGSTADVLARIRLTSEADDDLNRADLVVETICEDPEAKITLLRHIGALVRPDAIVTTNTSSLDLAALAQAVPGPARFAGLHWFNPADLVELVEVVPVPGTAPGTVGTLRAWMVALGKTPVVLRHAVPGFVANRLQYALLREAYALVRAGVCTWADADLAVAAGLAPRWSAVGPFQSMDLAGLDVHLAVARALFPVLATDTGPPALVADLVAAGRLGAKTGSGLLGDYPPERQQFLARLRDAMLRCVPAARGAALRGEADGPLTGQGR
jgi:3-hydroxybutyryl-CoA dehydrogenase